MKLRFFALVCSISLLFASLCGCKQGGISDGSKEKPQAQTDPRLAAATELVNRIDSLTSVQDLLQVSDPTDGMRGSAPASTTSALSAAELGYTVYDRNEADYDPVDFWSDVQYANTAIDQLKRFKEDAIGICVSLNVWVKVAPRDDAARYRITYHEENANTVTVECNDDEYYQKATVAYDENGKLMIDSYNISYEVSYDGQGPDACTHQIHYLEDSYIRVVFENENPDFYQSPSLLFVDLANRFYSQVYSPITEVGENGEPIYHATASINYWDGDYFITANKTSLQLYRDDREIITCQLDALYGNALNIRIPLNNLMGWSSIRFYSNSDAENRAYSLHTDTGDLPIFRGTSPTLDNGSIPFSVFMESTPGLSFRPNEPYPPRTETITALLDTLQRELGLSLSDTVEQLFLNALTAYEELAPQTHLLEGIYVSDITTETYLQLYDLLIYHKITPEDLTQMRQEEAIEKEEQYSFNANVFDTQGDGNGGGISTFTVPADASVGDMVVVSP